LCCGKSLLSMNKQPIFIEKYMPIKLKQICLKIKPNLTFFLNISNLKRNWIQVRYLSKLIFSQNLHKSNLDSCALCLAQTSMWLACRRLQLNPEYETWPRLAQMAKSTSFMIFCFLKFQGIFQHEPMDPFPSLSSSATNYNI
jgi:hypothetical protein